MLGSHAGHKNDTTTIVSSHLVAVLCYFADLLSIKDIPFLRRITGWAVS